MFDITFFIYIIQNSWRPLRGLSHSVVIFQNALSPYQREFVALLSVVVS